MMRLQLAVALLLAGLAAGCTARGTILIAPEAAGTGAEHRIYVATSRDADVGPIFGQTRAREMSFARFTVSVPPDRAPGSVVWPQRQPPDPEREFVTLEAIRLAGMDLFRAAIDRDLAARPAGAREITVFTHGFNTNFAEGLYRQAQMRHDFGTPGVSVHYAWPSAGRLRAYATDRESAIFARDGLEALIRALGRTRAERIIVGAHSMGALVLMESLRQMALRGDEVALGKLQAVVLMNPDLDIDVFRSQMAALADRDVPVYIFVSANDRALWFSSLLRGREVRLGALVDAETIEDLPVTVIDVTRVGDGGDALDHMAVATSPTMIAMISGMRDYGADIFAEEDRGPGLIEGTVNVVQGTASLVLEPLVPDY